MITCDHVDFLKTFVYFQKYLMNDFVLSIWKEKSVQMFGGIGMTDEHDMGLYIKRSRVAEG